MNEGQWWNELQGDDVETNAYGWPHYDVEAVADFIDRHIHFDTRVLDLGCGPGRLGHLLAGRHPDCYLYGVDVSHQMVTLSHIDSPSNWFASANDGATLPPNRPYSGAYSVTVFQHIQHHVVKSYVQQVYDLLCFGGRFLFSYAVGDVDTFLSHQASHDIALSWLHDAGFDTQLLGLRHLGWHWAMGQK